MSWTALSTNTSGCLPPETDQPAELREELRKVPESPPPPTLANITEDSRVLDSVYSALVLSVATGIVSLCYFAFKKMWEFLQQRIYTTLTLTRYHEGYEWILRWMARQKSLMQRSNLSFKVKRDVAKTKQTNLPDLDWRPGHGQFVWNFKSEDGEEGKIWITHGQGQAFAASGGWGRGRTEEFHKIHLTTWAHKAHLIRKMVQQCMESVYDEDKDYTNIYTSPWGWHWRKQKSMLPREKKSVILPTGIYEDLVADVKRFRTGEAWYRERGVPWRRGYMLYGMPGCGKTSFITALAGEVGLNVCILDISNPELNDCKLNRLLHHAPKDALILIEDIDAIFQDRSSVQVRRDRQQFVTFSGLLNALDGVASQEGRMMFMTTNHLEKLDPALIRPGRCDRRVEFKPATADQIKNIFLKFFPNEEKYAEHFEKNIPEDKFSMAKLQGFLLRKNTAKEAAEQSDELVKGGDEFAQNILLKQWLRRLAFGEDCFEQTNRALYEAFAEEGIRDVTDLQAIKEEDLKEFGITRKAEKYRFMAMLNGKDKDVKRDFALANEGSIRAFVGTKVEGVSRVDEIVALIPERLISIHQLRAIFAQHERWSDLILAVRKCVELNCPEKFVAKWASEVVETEAISNDDEKEPGYVMGLLADLKLERYAKAFRDQEILDVDTFKKLDEGKLKELGVSVLGHRLKLHAVIEKIKKKEEDEQKELEKAKEKAQKQEEEQKAKLQKEKESLVVS